MKKPAPFMSILSYIFVVNIICIPNAFSSSTLGPANMAQNYAVIFSAEGSFQDVSDDLTMAIESRGIKISNISYVATMLKRTASVLGVEKPVYNDAIAIEFCKADLSHNMLSANPHNIVFCPYRILAYTLNEKPNRVYLSYRRFHINPEAASQKPIAEVEKLLRELIEEAGGK